VARRRTPPDSAGFASYGWPVHGRARTVLRPERLTASLRTLAGVGPLLPRGWLESGSGVGNLSAGGRSRALKRIASSSATRVVLGSSSARSQAAMRRGRNSPAGCRRHRRDQATWFNQPWLERRLTPGAGAAAWPGRLSWPRPRLRGRAGTQTSHQCPAAGRRSAQLRDLRAQALGREDAGEPLPASCGSTGASLRSDAGRAHRPRSLAGRRRAFAARLRRALRAQLALVRAATATSRPRPSPWGRLRAPRAYRSSLRSRSQTTRNGRSTSSTGTPGARSRCSGSCRDVGASKTVVALYALLRAVEAGIGGAGG
jgi:hypothetical protein